VDNFPPLPIIHWGEAPANIYNLFDIISEYPDLKERIKGATFIKKRRWDIYLDDIKEGLLIKLPEEYPESALKKLIDMEKKYKVFKRKLTLIDLRLPDRIDIKGENGANINIPYLNDSDSEQKKGVNL
jgi:cell division protein FtsQ